MSYQRHFNENERQILQERAERVRHPVENKRMESTPLVYISLEKEVYAMRMVHLIGVHRGIAVVPVPCVPAFVSGVANIRGRVVPVLDLGKLLNVAASDTSPKVDERVLVVAGADGQEVVFHVDRIEDSRLSDATLKPLPDSFDVPYPEFIAGQLTDGTPQLDIIRLLTSPVLVINDSIQTTNR